MFSPILVKLMIGGLAGVSGGIIGALSRQPEINNLKKQIKKLQKEVERLQNIRKEQDEQLSMLLVKYKALKVYQFKKRAEERDNIRGIIIYQYGLYDYLTLLLNTAKGSVELQKDDTIFFNIFDKMIEGKKISDEEMDTMKKYITFKHKSDIRRMRQCNIDNLVFDLQNIDVKKLEVNKQNRG